MLAHDLEAAHHYLCSPGNWSVGAWFLAGLACLVVLALVSERATDKAKAAAAAQHAARKRVGRGDRADRQAVSHIDGDPTNNDPANLRVVTVSRNLRNAR